MSLLSLDVPHAGIANSIIGGESLIATHQQDVTSVIWETVMAGSKLPSDDGQQSRGFECGYDWVDRLTMKIAIGARSQWAYANRSDNEMLQMVDGNIGSYDVGIEVLSSEDEDVPVVRSRRRQSRVETNSQATHPEGALCHVCVTTLIGLIPFASNVKRIAYQRGARIPRQLLRFGRVRQRRTQ